MTLRVALVVVLAATVVAQEQPPRPTFRTEANYIRVDVYPTKDGTPVADLTKEDFEILDNGVRQTVEQFERIVIRPAGPQDSRVEPNNVREMRSMLENSRARVFVVFLDTYHVDVGGSHDIRKPLIDSLDRVISEDDLVGVMTPYMSPADIAFARKTTTIAGMLTRYWAWGTRDRVNNPDPEDDGYEACYPVVPPGDRCADQNGIAARMIARRHEKRTLDALQDLVRFLRGVREERKAVIAISPGWLQYRNDYDLAKALACHGTTDHPEVGIDPRTGKLVGNNADPYSASERKCGIDRFFLAQIDNEREFRDILDEANRANASFYPVDPRGLAAFDTPMSNPAPLAVDAAMLRTRVTSLRTLAEATDGLAIVQTNDLAGGLKRVVDDLSSYYLLGYYSTAKLDGKFHSISVRVKRPGIQVRARRGYLAATPGTAAAATATAMAAATPANADAETAAVAAAVAPLAGYTREVPLRVQAATGWRPGVQSSPFVVVEGEVSGAREYEELWRGGGTATIELAPADGASVATVRLTIAPESRTFRAVLTPSQPLAPGEYVVRTSTRGGDASPSRDTLRLTLAASPQASGAIWFRRGPSTLNKDSPTADLRFRRSEQAIVEVPASSTSAPTARLLDRSGKALNVPVSATVRDDPDGTRWQRAQLALAPLGAGEYVIEVSEGNARTLAAFKIVP
jgi:VWFA-related protein